MKKKNLQGFVHNGSSGHATVPILPILDDFAVGTGSFNPELVSSDVPTDAGRDIVEGLVRVLDGDDHLRLLAACVRNQRMRTLGGLTRPIH